MLLGRGKPRPHLGRASPAPTPRMRGAEQRPAIGFAFYRASGLIKFQTREKKEEENEKKD